MTAVNRAAEQSLTPAMVREFMRYDPNSGVFTWRKTLGQRAQAGNVILGADNGYGYIRIAVKGKNYMAHRLAWAYMLGRWPEDIVDHRDRDRSNNRWINLRAATYATNNQNKKVKVGASGLRGAYKMKGVKKSTSKHWMSVIQVDGKSIHLGQFHTAEEAHAAYAEAANKYHGEFNSMEIV